MSTTDLPISEITIRKFERPENIDKKVLIRRFCISLGLINSGDNRAGCVDVFEVIFNSKEPLSAEEVFESLGKKLALSGIRRHLRRLERIRILEHRNSKYQIAEGRNLSYCLKYVVKDYLIEDIFNRISEYGEKLQNLLDSEK
ncbi:MAG: hypothetical protein V1820_01705 [archaeon]